ncbi:uncharacterized protein J3R85_015297 [Psidium guajava]|nr:uncharacterized protein J3R85_015297 [Psidium guajava]
MVQRENPYGGAPGGREEWTGACAMVERIQDEVPKGGVSRKKESAESLRRKKKEEKKEEHQRKSRELRGRRQRE